MMHLRPDLFRVAVRRLKGGDAVIFGTNDPSYRDWLGKRQLPEELTQFLIENSLSADTSFDGVGGMWTPNEIMQLNDQEEEGLSGNGLFGVGNTGTGDFIVINFITGDGQSGFVSHDLLPEPDVNREGYDVFKPIAVSIGDLLHGMTAIEGFPYDFWIALEYPILFNTDVITEPRGRCLGTSVEEIQRVLFRGSHLVDRRGIEEILGEEGLDSADRWSKTEPGREWFDFAAEGDRWTNDMKTVVFDFRIDNLTGGLTSLGFAQRLLKIAPDEFEYFWSGDRAFVRMHWVDGWKSE
jgi:hypothetical protein